MDEDKDTGDLTWVPEMVRFQQDHGEGANALDDLDHPGPDDDLADVYADPGEVVEGDLG